MRLLGLIYFSAFYSLLFQINGLIGPQGILPAQHYLAAVAHSVPGIRFWYAPSLFWLSSSSHTLITVMWIGLLASIAAIFDLWPRLSLFLCFVCFLSFVGASGEFSSYQSDGMLLEAGFVSLFFAPSGLLPGLGADHPPSRASLFLLQWEWFRIYFESGLVKLLSGDPQWRGLTAMDEYYQNGPLPTWIGWYVEHLPHGFHVATAAGTLIMELVVVFLLFLPRRFRLICFFIVTPWEIGVILTANYTFLNYLVLSLGFLLLDDKFLLRWVPRQWRPPAVERVSDPEAEALPAFAGSSRYDEDRSSKLSYVLGAQTRVARLAISAIMLTWIAYDTTAEMIGMPFHKVPLPSAPITALEPFRIANQYGLFAVMTRGRFEIEFQGSNDGIHWIAYPFRYKPQALNERPRVYAPYQPRFDWNLWFASLSDWQQNNIVPLTEERLLTNDADVLGLFRSNPFEQAPPRYVKAVLWQYWFTTAQEKHGTGNWWRRELMGLYAPEVMRNAAGEVTVVEWPGDLPPHS